VRKQISELLLAFINSFHINSFHQYLSSIPFININTLILDAGGSQSVSRSELLKGVVIYNIITFVGWLVCQKISPELPEPREVAQEEAEREEG
jgi:hypothetical protein